MYSHSARSLKSQAYVSAGLLVFLAACGENSDDSSSGDASPSLMATAPSTSVPGADTAGPPAPGGMQTIAQGPATTTMVPNGGAGAPGDPAIAPIPTGGVDPVNAGTAGTPGVPDTPGASGAGAGGSPEAEPVSPSGNAGMDSSGGMSGAPAQGGAAGSDDGTGGTPDEGTEPLDPAVEQFSFFVVSMSALQELSDNPDGFGGDLRFGQESGLEGADEICRQAAEMGMPGAGQKTWRAFLSVTSGPDGNPVNARDRIGSGPWHDALGRLVSEDLDGLFAGDRPAGDPTIVEDLPNERGEPNNYVGPTGLDTQVYDNHDTITGSDTEGMLESTDPADTCEDWTSTSASGRPMCGHSWPRNATSGRHWASDHNVPGCAPGLDRTLGGSGDGNCIGCSGGYGGFYCFALPSGDD